MTELDRLLACAEESQAIGGFLDWLTGVRGVELTETVDDVRRERCEGEGCVDGILAGPVTEKVGPGVVRFTAMAGDTCPRCAGSGEEERVVGTERTSLAGGFERLLAEYYGIDLVKVEAERREILAALGGRGER